MLVSLINGLNTWTEDLPVSAISAALIAKGEVGQLSLTVPGTSAGASQRYINILGGRSLVRVQDAAWGTYLFIVETAQDAPGGGVTLECREVSASLDAEAVPDGILSGITAGTVIRAAYQRSYAGQATPHVRLGGTAESPPSMLSYEFRGQTLMDVISDMTAATGQEAHIRDSLLYWGPPAGRYYQPRLMDGGDLTLTSGVTMDASSLLKAVTARGSQGGSYTAYAAENASKAGAKHTTIQVSDVGFGALKQIAIAALEAGRYPSITVEANLHWTRSAPRGSTPVRHAEQVREGDVIIVGLPGAAAGGLTERFRVLSRSWSAAAPAVVPLTLQYLAPPMQETIATFTMRVLPPVVRPVERNPYRVLRNLSNDVRRLERR